MQQEFFKRAGQWEEGIRDALDNFLEGPDFEPALRDSTAAGFSGSGYSVELCPDSTYRVLYDGQIGNLYSSPGIILALPQYGGEEWQAYLDADEPIGDFDGAIAQELRDELDVLLAVR